MTFEEFLKKYRPKKPRWKLEAPLPDWVGNYPLKPEEKKPIVITKEMILTGLYGKPGHQAPMWLYISTDKIANFNVYAVPPGVFFEPPDIHGGDEVYYVIKGIITVHNIETGEVHEVHEGEALIIPTGCWHVGYNFTDKETLVQTTITPYIWFPEEGPPPEYTGKTKLYKVEEE